MALKNEGMGRYTVVCDDPYRRGCEGQIGPYFGHDRVVRIAQENNWYVSEATDKHSCPTCMGLHNMTVEKKIENGSMTREEANNSGDPFTAAFIAMAFGGDPLTAGLTTMFTGSTSLGVIAGIMAGDHEMHSEEKPFEGGGGQFSGAGATGSFDDQQTSQNPDTVSGKVEGGVQQAPPLIVDPFAMQGLQGNVEKDVSPSVDEKTVTEETGHEEPPHDESSADTSPGTAY